MSLLMWHDAKAPRLPSRWPLLGLMALLAACSPEGSAGKSADAAGEPDAHRAHDAGTTPGPERDVALLPEGSDAGQRDVTSPTPDAEDVEDAEVDAPEADASGEGDAGVGTDTGQPGDGGGSQGPQDVGSAETDAEPDPAADAGPVDTGVDEDGGHATDAGGNDAGQVADAGGGDVDQDPAEEVCVSKEQFFLREVWGPVISESCFNCHNPLGVAASSELVFEPEGQPGFLKRNIEVFANVAAYERQGTSVLLLKPTAQVSHGGGRRFLVGSPEYQAIASMIDYLNAGAQDCPEPEDDGLFDRVELLGPQDTFRKATLNLGGRLPTWQEVQFIAQGGEQALDVLLERLMREEVFYVRMEEAFNDLFLTQKYLGNTRALDLLERTVFPGARWYDDPTFNRSSLSAEFVSSGARHTNDSVAREPVKLVSHILRNDRPFSDIVLADYTVVNPFSAMAYGIQDIAWTDPLNHEEWRAGRIPGLEHAGVMSSPMFMNRFPTTPTNRNRHRARMLYKFFLATDVLKLGERPIDPTSVQHNPTMNDPQCAGCHSVIDPVAGALQTFNQRGSYALPDSWYTDMRQPGFGRDLMPPEERPRAHRWLAQRIAWDERFALSMVQVAFQALTGQTPLALPVASTDLEHYGERLAAYERQQNDFNLLAREFELNGYNFRTILKGIILSPWFRAANLVAAADEVQRRTLASVGTGRLVPPEQLNRKVEAILGFPWRPRVAEADYLLRRDWFMLLYGGLDGDDVIERLREPNGIMSAIQTRMANEMACLAVPQDFSLPILNRRLFPDVEVAYVPEDGNGFEIPRAVLGIRQNIQRLHRLVLGESLPLDHPEIERTYQLFYDTWKEGKQLRAQGAIGQDLAWNCQARNDYWSGVALPGNRIVQRDADYTIRAWMAVVTYMLLDYKFLYE